MIYKKNSKLPNKIFNRLHSIPLGQVIYLSTKGGNYKFAGVRDKRKSYECVLYSIPNNKSKYFPYLKGLQKQEVDLLWHILKKDNKLTTKTIKEKLPELYKEGGCCVSGFYGMINYLFPKTFIRIRGGIRQV